MYKFLVRIKRQGSGMHLYFTTEMLRNQSFPFKADDMVVLLLDGNEIRIRKVDVEKL